MIEFEHRIRVLMKEAEEELRSIGIKPSSKILEIKANHRAKKRLGCCKIERKGLGQVFRIEHRLQLRGEKTKPHYPDDTFKCCYIYIHHGFRDGHLPDLSKASPVLTV